MANLKASKKDVRRIAKKTVKNAAQKSKVRTMLKKAKAVSAKCENYQEGMDAIVQYEKHAKIAMKRHLFSKNAVARRVSDLVQNLKKRFKKEEQVLAKKVKKTA